MRFPCCFQKISSRCRPLLFCCGVFLVSLAAACTPAPRTGTGAKKKNSPDTVKMSRERRSNRQLAAARRLLENGEESARGQLQAIVEDRGAPVRNRARAQWLLLETSPGGSNAEAYWRLLYRFPASVAAEDALRKALALSDAPDSAKVRRLLTFYRRHPAALAADLALLEAARLSLRVGTPPWRRYAVHLLLFLARNHPESPYRDEALYRAAEIQRKMGNIKQAIQILKQLLQYIEYSIGFGDYNSEWMDDAQFLLGELYLSAGNAKKAAQTWEDLPKRFPHSRLRDRAWVQLMRLYEAKRDRTSACLAARTLLGKMPHSRFADEARVFLARCVRVP